jgi:hypothetical protein
MIKHIIHDFQVPRKEKRIRTERINFGELRYEWLFLFQTGILMET